MKYPSLYKYATQRLKFDGKNIYPYITLSKKAKAIQALQSALKNSKLTIAAASRLVSILTTENADHWIEFSRTHTFEETEQELAKHFPRMKKPDKVKIISEEEVELRLTVSKKTVDNLKRLQSLEAQKGNLLTLGECLEISLERDVERQDPVRRAQRFEKNKAKRESKRAEQKNKNETHPANALSKNLRSETFGLHRKSEMNSKFKIIPNEDPIPAPVQRQVDLRDEGKCTQLDVNGNRCNSDRWTHSHHIIFRRDGGPNTLENLTTLCSFHHDLIHQISLPMDEVLRREQQILPN